uniref:Endonuclease/exonuclease/phosphatase domain-containing protein n=1 Tax=Phlebotomus papatasi TaxID=29031 RepID=A0A1B0DJV0_PHLPP
MRANKIDLIALQETHTKDDDDLKRRGNIPGYSLVAALHSQTHGVATYAQTNICDINVLLAATVNAVQVIVIELCGVKVLNVYKPPNVAWADPPMPRFQHPTIYVVIPTYGGMELVMVMESL